MRRIVQPSRRTARVRERDERDAIRHTQSANGVLEWDLAPEAFDREAAEKEDDLRPQQRELLIQPSCAQRDLGGRWPTIATPVRSLSREAFRDGGPVWQMFLVDARACEPAPELRAGTTAEGLTSRELDGTGSLTDDRDAVAHGSGHDGTGPLEETCVDAFRAAADASVQKLELTFAMHRPQAHE